MSTFFLLFFTMFGLYLANYSELSLTINYKIIVKTKPSNFSDHINFIRLLLDRLLALQTLNILLKLNKIRNFDQKNDQNLAFSTLMSFLAENIGCPTILNKNLRKKNFMIFLGDL